MKLTIEGLLDKWGYKQDEVWHRAQIRADIQAYVKQEMKLLQDSIKFVDYPKNIPITSHMAFGVGKLNVLTRLNTAIENYGKEK